MAYEIFKKKLNKEQFFNLLENRQTVALAEDIKKERYEKYLLKREVFSRDNYVCQNENCKSKKPELTIHHVKWQKNGGKNSARNCVTVCADCHEDYHAARGSLTFGEGMYLPNHIRNHIYQLDKSDKINWKVIRKEMKTLRKTLKSERVYISMRQIALLLEWLNQINRED